MNMDGANATGHSRQAAGQAVDGDETYRLIASNKVEGTEVRRPNGDKVGAIDKVMIDKRSGRVAYAVMSFGGFLGIGANRMPVPWDMLRYNEELDAYELDVTEQQLQGAPAYADDDSFDWSDPVWNRSMRSHYGERRSDVPLGGGSMRGEGI